MELCGLAAVLAGASLTPLAVDADALAAAVPAVVSLTSVNADLRPAALLALGANPLVHADAAAAALLAPGANPLVHADAAAAALLRTARVERRRGVAQCGVWRNARTLHSERSRSWWQICEPPQSRHRFFWRLCSQRHRFFGFRSPRHTRYSYGP